MTDPAAPSPASAPEPSLTPPPVAPTERITIPRVPVFVPAARDPKHPESRIRLDSSLRRWFSRNLGVWRSRRLYFFSDDEVLRVDMFLQVELFHEPIEGEAGYRFTWWPENEHGFFERKPRFVPEGTMEAYLCGHQLRRSRGYLCGSPTKSRIRQVDEHEVIFESHYQEWDILEHIRLVDQDRFRARSIYSWRDGVLDLAEIHHESRVETPIAPPSHLA
jgi:hypothetical protein